MTRRALCLILIPLVLAGCDSTMRTQHKAKDNGTTDAWPSGRTARPVPEHTVAIGDAAWRAADANPPRVTRAFLARGHERYDIFCSACHGFDGNGHGAVVQRGYPYPGSLNGAKARALPAPAIYSAITDGVGIMYSYASQISPQDRWAIAAYVRALQLSQHVKVAARPDIRAKLP